MLFVLLGSKISDYPFHYCTSDYPFHYCTSDYPFHYCTSDYPFHYCTSDYPFHYCTSDYPFHYCTSDNPFHYCTSDNPFHYCTLLTSTEQIKPSITVTLVYSSLMYSEATRLISSYKIYKSSRIYFTYFS